MFRKSFLLCMAGLLIISFALSACSATTFTDQDCIEVAKAQRDGVLIIVQGSTTTLSGAQGFGLSDRYLGGMSGALKKLTPVGDREMFKLAGRCGQTTALAGLLALVAAKVVTSTVETMAAPSAVGFLWAIPIALLLALFVMRRWAAA